MFTLRNGTTMRLDTAVASPADIFLFYEMYIFGAPREGASSAFHQAKLGIKPPSTVHFRPVDAPPGERTIGMDVDIGPESKKRPDFPPMANEKTYIISLVVCIAKRARDCVWFTSSKTLETLDIEHNPGWILLSDVK